jgi:hypothetical protein
MTTENPPSHPTPARPTERAADAPAGAPADPPGPIVVHAAGAAEFLATVPHLAGYVPRDSLVLVPFAGRRTLGAMRIDLPAADVDAAQLPDLAAACIAAFARVRHADRVAIVVYTLDPFRDGRGRIARAALVEALARCAEETGYPIVEALCVAADAWGSYLERDGPWSGHPLERIRADRVEWPERPDEPMRADQADGWQLPAGDPVERERVARAMAGITARLDDPTIPEVLEDAVAREQDLPPRALALLALMLDRPAIRDIALTQWCGGLEQGRAIQRFNVAWAAGEDPDFDGPLALAGEGPPPDAARLRRALALVKRVAAGAPREHRAGALASAAWLSWALGRSTHAARLVELTRGIDPDHGLADIVARMIAGGHLPSWVYDRPAPGPPPAARAVRRGARRRS